MVIVARSLVAICLLGQPVAAHALGGYWGIGLSGVRAEDEIGDSIRPKNLYAHLGYDFTRHVGLEFQSSITLFEDEFEGADWSAAVNGFYVKGGLPVSPSVNIFVLGGYASVDLAVDVGFGYISSQESGPSYGVGADIGLSDDLGLGLRYMSYLQEDGLFAEVRGLNVALNWSF